MLPIFKLGNDIVAHYQTTHWETTMLPIIKQPTGKRQYSPSLNSQLGNDNVAHYQTAHWETAMLPFIKQPTGKRQCCPL